MSGQMDIDFASWTRAAGAFQDVASSAPSTLGSVVSQTTDAGACGAAGGLATVDGAVAIMLSVFGEVMNGTVVPSLSNGLASEAEALTQTGVALQGMEDENTDTAKSVEGWLA